MKFYYQYRTSDNVRHDGEIKAASREAAFAALKARGIRPGCMVEAPGFFNKLWGKGKRWMAIAFLAIVSVALLFHVNSERYAVSVADERGPIDRRQLLGDASVIENGVKTEWADVFDRLSDRFLAKYLQPGVPVVADDKEALQEVCKDLCATMENCIPVDDSDLDEVKQVKRIVAGMRCELAEYVRDGGTVEEYIECLLQRQAYEIQMRRRAQMELNHVRITRPYDEYVKEWKV